MTLLDRYYLYRTKKLVQSIDYNEKFIVKCQSYIKRARKQIKKDQKELNKKLKELNNNGN